MGPTNPSVEPSSQGRLPRPGEVLAGKFQVESVLGVGGMGGVFAARDLQLHRRVAVKVMLPHLTENPEFASRFLREAKAASGLESEHVARVFDVGHFADGSPYMVMELLEGKDLDDLVRARGPLPIPEAVRYVLEACDAIAEAHRRGVVHRDLKPSNLFLAEQPGHAPMIKVLDFGISKSTKLDGGGGGGPGEQQTLTATDSTLGSPHYMSPEQLRSAKKVDLRTDIWSLGVILHKLLTGHLAFESDSIGAHLAMIVADPPTPLRQRRPDAPVALENVILRCLQKDLLVRFQNIGQLVVALAPFAPADAAGLVDRIVSLVGREASTAPLPPFDSARATLSPNTPAPMIDPNDAATIAGWTPGDRRKPARGGLVVALVGGVIVLAVGAGVGAQQLLGGRAPVVASAPAAVPPPAATASAAPLSAEITVKLEVEPRDAVVELDGAPVRDNPLRLPRGERVHKLVVHAPGYAAEARDLGAQEDAAIAIALHREARDAPRVAPGKLGPRPAAPAPAPDAPPPPPKKLGGPMETKL
jgi:serine/threonine-protein kinase